MSDNPPSALVEKYRLLATDLDTMRQKVKTGEHQLAHLRAAILMFDPQFRFATLPIKRREPTPGPQTERIRLAFDVLRTAPQPMTAHAIAKEVLALSGAQHVDSYAVERCAVSIYSFLYRQEKRGTVQLVARDPKRWEIVS